MAEREYLAISPNYWGRGDSVIAAKGKLKEMGGSLSDYVVLEMPEGATESRVDAFGRIHWKWADEKYFGTFPSPKVVTGRGQSRKNFEES